MVAEKNSPINVSQHSGLDLLKLDQDARRSGLHLNFYFIAGQRCLCVDLKKNMPFIYRSIVLKHLLDCVTFALPFQTKLEVSKSFIMPPCEEEMMVFLLLLVQCLPRGSPLNWSERKRSDLFGVMDKVSKTEISE